MTGVSWSRRAFLAASAAAVAGCAQETPKQPQATSPTSTPSATHRFEVAVVAPLSGTFTAFGIGIEHSVKLALSDADPQLLGYRMYDSTSDPMKAITAVRDAQDTPRTIAVIGPVLATAAAGLEPVLSTDDAPVLYLGGWSEVPQPPTDVAVAPPQVFSMAAPLNDQVDQLVFYCMRMRNLRSFLIVENRDEFPADVARNISQSVVALGGTAPTSISLPHFVDLDDPIATSLAANPVDGIFCVGGVDTALRIRRACRQAKARPVLAGMAAIVSSSYAASVQNADLPHLAVAGYLDEYPAQGEADFTRAYDAAGFQDPWESYGPLAYDAAHLIANNLSDAIVAAGTSLNPLYVGPQAQPDTVAVRAELHDLLRETATTGVTGPIKFDARRANVANDIKLMSIINSEWRLLH